MERRDSLCLTEFRNVEPQGYAGQYKTGNLGHILLQKGLLLGHWFPLFLGNCAHQSTMASIITLYWNYSTTLLQRRVLLLGASLNENSIVNNIDEHLLCTSTICILIFSRRARFLNKLRCQQTTPDH